MLNRIQFEELPSCIYGNYNHQHQQQQQQQQNSDNSSFSEVQQNFLQYETIGSTAEESAPIESLKSFENFNHHSKNAGKASQERKKTLSSINAAYDELRVHVPTFPYEKRLSKIDTLQLAIAYISLLQDVLEVDCDPFTYVQKCLRGEIRADEANWNTSDLTARLSWINWENLGVNPAKQSSNFRSWC